MRQMRWVAQAVLTVFVLTLSFAIGLAQDQVEKVSEGPPSEVSAEIRDSMGTEGFRVLLGSREIGQFWFRQGFPKEGSSGDLGVNFGQIEPSTLVGIVKLTREWTDYKGMPVPAGCFTLRFNRVPADGNHMGVSVYRDFLQLIPAAEDEALNAKYSYDELNELSSKASGTPHPAVMALFPIWDEISETSLVKNEVDQWTLAWKDGDLTLGVVVEGHGEM